MLRVALQVTGLALTLALSGPAQAQQDPSPAERWQAKVLEALSTRDVWVAVDFSFVAGGGVAVPASGSLVMKGQTLRARCEERQAMRSLVRLICSDGNMVSARHVQDGQERLDETVPARDGVRALAARGVFLLGAGYLVSDGASALVQGGGEQALELQGLTLVSEGPTEVRLGFDVHTQGQVFRVALTIDPQTALPRERAISLVRGEQAVEVAREAWRPAGQR